MWTQSKKQALCLTWIIITVLIIIHTYIQTSFYQDGSSNRVDTANLDRNGQSESSMVKNEEEKLPWWDGGECIQKSEGQWIPRDPSVESLFPRRLSVDGTCSRRASSDGKNQKVISFSIFGSNPNYWSGLPETLSRVKVLYPGWKVWVYTDPRGKSGFLCRLLNEHTHFRLCDVTNLPKPLYDISTVDPTMWRIAPLGDPNIDVLIIRDSDMQFSERDQSAVLDWLSSGKIFHVMRDHPGHKAHVMAGMWGARWDMVPRNSTDEREIASVTSFRPNSSIDLLKIRNKMLRIAFNKFEGGIDQMILRRELWPDMVGSLVSHDSFFCKKFTAGWKPWPKERVNGTYAGNVWYREKVRDTLKYHCPPECRPPDHPDWLFC